MNNVSPTEAEIARTCTVCHKIKPLIDFPSSRNMGLSRCRECYRAIRREQYVAKGKIKRVRKANLARYGLTPEDFERMVEAQGNLCAICGNPQSVSHGTLYVDHDHNTGVVRALLCGPCNFVIGYLEKNPVDPHLLIAYLDKHSALALEP